jgi:hypothetical protein
MDPTIESLCKIRCGVQASANMLGVVFFSIVYMQFLGLAQCAETIERLPVFYKHKYTLFFPGWAYAIPSPILHIPKVVLEVTLWSMLVYWIVGFESDVTRYDAYLLEQVDCCLQMCSCISELSYWTKRGCLPRNDMYLTHTSTCSPAATDGTQTGLYPLRKC